MYMVLTWKVLGATVPADVRAEVLQEIRDAGFVNTREVIEKQFISNVPPGKGVGLVQSLEHTLGALAINRYSFTLYYLGRGNVVFHSDDVADAPLVRICDF